MCALPYVCVCDAAINYQVCNSVMTIQSRILGDTSNLYLLLNCPVYQ